MAGLIYAEYKTIGQLVFLTWIFPGMESEFETHYRHLFWRFYKKYEKR